MNDTAEWAKKQAFYSASAYSLLYDRFRLTVSPSVCLSQRGIMSKRLKLRSCGLLWRI